MKKYLKRALGLILALSTLLCVSAPSFAAGFDDVVPYSRYTCFGDSIAAIFRDEGYRTFGFKEIEGSYPSLVRHACGAELDTYAYAGFTTEQVRYWFEPDYVMHDYTFWALPDFCNVNTVDSMRGEVLNSVKNSDLITLNLGSNDVFSMALLMSFDGDYSSYFENTGIGSLDDLVSLLNTLGILTQFLATFVQNVDDRMAALYDNMNAILNDISTLNPDADVCVIGMYNPFDGMGLTAESLLAFGDIGYTIVNEANLILSSLALRYGYKYVDVIGTETYYKTSDLHVLDASTFSYLSDYVHPTAEGHRFMAERILSVLPARPMYEIRLEGIKKADTVYLDAVPYKAEVKDGVVTVTVDKTDYKTATVYGSSNLKQVWKLSFADGCYSAKAVSAAEAPVTYVAVTVGAIIKISQSAVKGLLTALFK